MVRFQQIRQRGRPKGGYVGRRLADDRQIVFGPTQIVFGSSKPPSDPRRQSSAWPRRPCPGTSRAITGKATSVTTGLVAESKASARVVKRTLTSGWTIPFARYTDESSSSGLAGRSPPPRRCRSAFDFCPSRLPLHCRSRPTCLPETGELPENDRRCAASRVAAPHGVAPTVSRPAVSAAAEVPKLTVPPGGRGGRCSTGSSLLSYVR